MMTRTTLMLRCVMGAGLALGAVLATPPSLAQEVELTFAHFLANRSTEAPNVRAALERYAELYPDVVIDEQISGTDEYLTQFNVGAASGEVPDVFMMNGSDTTGLVAAGLVGDITDDLAADPEWGGIIPDAMLTEFTRDGRTYAVPYGQIITHVIYYNQDMFAAAGIDTFPDTWDGFIAAVDALRASGVTPIALGNRGRWVVVDPLFGTLQYRHHGPDFLDALKAGEASMTDDVFVAALEDFNELVAHDAFNEDANSLDNMQQRDLYFNGDAAMFIEGSWAIPGIIENASPELLAATRIAIWPAVEDGGGEAYADLVSGGAGWSYAIAADLEGERREAAINLLRELSNTDYGRSRLEIGLLPAQMLGDSANDIEMPRLLQEVSGLVGTGEWRVVPIVATNMPRSFLDVAGEALQDLMVGNKTPAEVAETLQADFERSQ